LKDDCRSSCAVNTGHLRIECAEVCGEPTYLQRLPWAVAGGLTQSFAVE
jgi:hypothetical protein